MVSDEGEEKARVKLYETDTARSESGVIRLLSGDGELYVGDLIFDIVVHIKDGEKKPPFNQNRINFKSKIPEIVESFEAGEELNAENYGKFYKMINGSKEIEGYRLLKGELDRYHKPTDQGNKKGT